jgi:hypothetical protein
VTLRNIIFVQSDNWQQSRRKTKGRGWADMKATTAVNTFTGKGGPKRG